MVGIPVGDEIGSGVNVEVGSGVLVGIDVGEGSAVWVGGRVGVAAEKPGEPQPVNNKQKITRAKN
jgi:hypothetical protein